MVELRPPSTGGRAHSPSFDAASTRSIIDAPARSCTMPNSRRRVPPRRQPLRHTISPPLPDRRRSARHGRSRAARTAERLASWPSAAIAGTPFWRTPFLRGIRRRRSVWPGLARFSLLSFMLLACSSRRALIAGWASFARRSASAMACAYSLSASDRAPARHADIAAAVLQPENRRRASPAACSAFLCCSKASAVFARSQRCAGFPPAARGACWAEADAARNRPAASASRMHISSLRPMPTG